MNEAELILDAKSRLGEGPVWHPEEQVLYWVDIESKRLHRFDPATGENEFQQFDRKVGAAVPSRGGGFLLAMQDGIYKLASFGGGKPELAAAPEGLASDERFNDGKCDPFGRFWAGTMPAGGKPEGKLFMLDREHRLHVKAEGVTCSNGLAWDVARDAMYYIDTPTRTVLAYDYDGETGSIRNGRAAISVAADDGVPDGMSIDEEGMLWVAHWGGNQVIRYNPATGEALERIVIPAALCTSCAFGGANLDELYITSASLGRDPEQESLAGSLFRIKLGVRGTAATLFG